MKLEFLGTGTSMGVPQIGCECSVCRSGDARDQRLRSSIWLRTEALSLIVDTGPDFRCQCLRSNVARVDAVFYTHFHADHIFGIDDLRIYNYLQNRHIPVYLPEFMVERFRYCFDYTITEPSPGLTRPRFQIHVVNDEPIQLAELTIQPVDIHHGDENVKGYVFISGDAKIAYLTDCKVLPEATIAAARGADVVILSALWNLDRTHPGHMNLREALALAERIQGKQTYLMHLTHRIGLHRETAELLPSNTFLAYDGLVLEV